jgi:hypothetical protein
MMPTLDILTEQGSLKTNAAEIIFAVMHFPSESQVVERRRYQSFLETQQLFRRYERTCREMDEPDPFDPLNRNLHLGPRPKPDFTYEEVVKIREGRDFAELVDQHERFYRYAYAAANCLMFMIHAETAYPEYNSFERWKHFYEGSEAEYMKGKTGMEWPNSHASLQNMISQFRSTQHLWAACLYTDRYIALINSDVNKAPGSASKSHMIRKYNAKYGFSFGGVYQINKLLSSCLFFQRQAVARLNQHARRRENWCAESEVWLLPKLDEHRLKLPDINAVLSKFRAPTREELESYQVRAYRPTKTEEATEKPAKRKKLVV